MNGAGAGVGVWGKEKHAARSSVPRGVDGLDGRGLLLGEVVAGVLALELLDAASGVNEGLLAGEEGV